MSALLTSFLKSFQKQGPSRHEFKVWQEQYFNEKRFMTERLGQAFCTDFAVADDHLKSLDSMVDATVVISTQYLH